LAVSSSLEQSSALGTNSAGKMVEWNLMFFLSSSFLQESIHNGFAILSLIQSNAEVSILMNFSQKNTSELVLRTPHQIS
jgi:hypothetical protein